MGVLEPILDVFRGIIIWLIESMGEIATIFYAVPSGGTEAELTVYGVLGVAALGISVVLLLLNKSLDFFKFR